MIGLNMKLYDSESIQLCINDYQIFTFSVPEELLNPLMDVYLCVCLEATTPSELPMSVVSECVYLMSETKIKL